MDDYEIIHKFSDNKANRLFFLSIASALIILSSITALIVVGSGKTGDDFKDFKPGSLLIEHSSNGRDVIYNEEKGLEYLYATPGVVSYEDNGVNEPRYVLGKFAGWEKIQGSKDSYILLTFPETSQELPRLRVGFEPGMLFDEDINLTRLFLENLNSGPWDTRSSTPYEQLGQIRLFSDRELSTLIKEGDIVSVTLLRLHDSDSPAKDGDGNFVANAVVVRRYGGKEILEKEIGRGIELPQDVQN